MIQKYSISCLHIRQMLPVSYSHSFKLATLFRYQCPCFGVACSLHRLSQKILRLNEHISRLIKPCQFTKQHRVTTRGIQPSFEDRFRLVSFTGKYRLALQQQLRKDCSSSNVTGETFYYLTEARVGLKVQLVLEAVSQVPAHLVQHLQCSLPTVLAF
jgi:hypothetical protein